METTTRRMLIALAAGLIGAMVGLWAMSQADHVEIVGAEDDCAEFYGAYRLTSVERVDALRVACNYGEGLL